MRIAITGATGFVGQALTAHLLAREHQVCVLSRDPTSAKGLVPAGATVRGFDEDGLPDLSEVDGVVHLAGAPAVGTRWTPARKEQILKSRVKGTDNVVRALGRLGQRPSVLVCASAVGFYGPRSAEERLTESEPSGEDFLAQVCVAWEGEALKAEALGVRVVRARLGIVLGPGGGALQTMALPFRLFAGGPIGDGAQMTSWIDLRDCAAALTFALENAALEGPVNVCAPNPVSNAHLSREIGRALGRPSYLPVPKLALKMLFREGSEPLTTGQRAVPDALLRAGFQFAHADLRACLKDHL